MDKEIIDKIKASATLVALSLGSFNPVKLDKKKTRELATANGCSTRVARVTKNILPTASVLEAIEKLDTRIRALVRQYTAPFARGVGLLPTSKFFALREEINPMFDERRALVAKLADEYNIYLSTAPQVLNGMFNPEDYPPVDVVVGRFYANLDLMGITNPEGERMGVLGEIASAVCQAQADTLKEKLEGLAPYTSEILLESLRNMSAKLQNPDCKWFDSLFENVLQSADKAESLNLLNDEGITNAVWAIRQNLKFTKEQLRSDDFLRKKMLSDCNTIIENLGGTIPPPEVKKSTTSSKAPKVSNDTEPEPAPEPDEPESTPEPEQLPPPPSEINVSEDDLSTDAAGLLAKLGW